MARLVSAFSLTRKLTGIPPFWVANRDRSGKRSCLAIAASGVNTPIRHPGFRDKAEPVAA